MVAASLRLGSFVSPPTGNRTSTDQISYEWSVCRSGHKIFLLRRICARLQERPRQARYRSRCALRATLSCLAWYTMRYVVACICKCCQLLCFYLIFRRTPVFGARQLFTRGDPELRRSKSSMPLRGASEEAGCSGLVVTHRLATLRRKLSERKTRSIESGEFLLPIRRPTGSTNMGGRILLRELCRSCPLKCKA